MVMPAYFPPRAHGGRPVGLKACGPLRAVLWALVGTAGCASPGGEPAAGSHVPLLVAPSTDRVLDIEIERMRLAGGRDSATELLVAGPEFAAASLERDVVYYYDDASRRVEVVDGFGRRVGRRGREGTGPGEYRRAAFLRTYLDGGLDLVDLAKRAVVAFDAAGDVLPEWSLPGASAVVGGVWRGAGLVIVHRRVASDQGPVRSLTVIQGPDERDLLRVWHHSPRRASIRCPDAVYHLRSTEGLLAAAIRWDASGDLLLAGVDSSYHVILYRDLVPVVGLRREMARIPADAAVLTALFPASWRVGDQGCRVPAGRLAEIVGMAAHLPVIR